MAGTPLVRDVILRDGTPLRLRTPAPGDYDNIKSLYDGLSDESRYTRFHGFARTELPARLDADLGGRQAGLGRDVAYGLLPFTDANARELIDASESLSIQLDGFRGSLPLDRVALEELILRFAALLRAVPELVEVDLNPLRCLPEGALVLDMRMRVERRSRAETERRW